MPENYQYGEPKCPHCQGRGRIPVPSRNGGPPAMQLCSCAVLREYLTDMERRWRGLSKAPNTPSSPLTSVAGKNVWITASESWMKMHLRHTVLKQPFRWEYRVVTDAGLLTAWLATAAIDGAKIYDADVSKAIEEGEMMHRKRPSFEYLTLADIALPSDLLVIKLGVKTTPNKEMPNTLWEVILARAHAGKATWVWDQPEHPVDAEDHRCYSFNLISEISGWERVVEGSDVVREPQPVTMRKVGLFTGTPMGNRSSTPAPAPPDPVSNFDVDTVIGAPVKSSTPPPPPFEEASDEEAELGDAEAEMLARLSDTRPTKKKFNRPRSKGFR